MHSNRSFTVLSVKDIPFLLANENAYAGDSMTLLT